MPMQAPFQGFPPELLAQIAQGAFRPPPAMGGGSPGGMQMPQAAGGGMGAGLGAGAAGLGMGLGMLGRGGSNISEQGAVGPGGLAGAVSSIDALKPDANGVWQQPTMPTDIGSGGGGGAFGSFGSWLKGLF